MPDMKAVIFDKGLRYVKDRPMPVLKPGWALIRVRLAGICKTDLELMKGYLGFTGVLGHEFLGVVEDCQDPAWVDKPVTGEINAACGQCQWCVQGLGRHCPERTTLGILNQDGCMAEYCTLPVENLIEIDPQIPDEQAILMEPLAAACEILEQIQFRGDERVVVLGDGRLGILCAWALSTRVSDVTLAGHHQEKLEAARWKGIKTVLGSWAVQPGADVVVDATGSGGGMARAMETCRPRGTIVLKSTVALQEEINLAPLVINEITVVGSRCGRFQDALDMIRSFPDMPLHRLITHRFPLNQAEQAFAVAEQGQALKVILEV